MNNHKGRYLETLDTYYYIQVFQKVLLHVNMLEDEQYDMDKLYRNQMLIRQLMNLKTKGKFFEET